MSTLTRITLGRLQSPGAAGGLVLAGFVSAGVSVDPLQAALVPGVNAGITGAELRAMVSSEMVASVGADAVVVGLGGAIVAEVD